MKFRLGLFDQPYVQDARSADKIVYTQCDEDFALEINRQSPLTAEEKTGIKNAVAKAKSADVVIVVVGEDEKCVGKAFPEQD